MKLVKCVCGDDCGVFQDKVYGGFFVRCETLSCWRGPVRRKKEEAIQAWNEVMGCFEEVGQLRRVLDGVISVAEVLIENGDIQGSMSLQGWCAEGKELLKKQKEPKPLEKVED